VMGDETMVSPYYLDRQMGSAGLPVILLRETEAAFESIVYDFSMVPAVIIASFASGLACFASVYGNGRRYTVIEVWRKLKIFGLAGLVRMGIKYS
jgi:hypothetical protein